MMRQLAIKLIGIVGVGLAAPRGLASDLPTLGMNLCTLHYSKVAYGKPVKAVFAHRGMYRDCSKFDGSAPYWADIRDVPLETSPDLESFGTKTVIYDRGSTYEPCHTQPIVQYWVTFDDGSSKIEEPVKVEITKTHFFSDERENLNLAGLISDFDILEPKDIKSTACIEVASYGNLAFDLVNSYAPTLHLENR